MPRLTILCAGIFVMSVPSKTIVPDAGCMRPEMVRNVVVLPAPLLPMSATISDLSTMSDTPWSACTRP